MKSETVLAIDIGTSSIKIGLLSQTGELLSFVRESLHVYTKELSLAEGSVRASAWEKALSHLLPQLEGIAEIRGICVTGNGPTIVPLNSEGYPSGGVIGWNDTDEYSTSLQKKEKEQAQTTASAEHSRSLFLPLIAKRIQQIPVLRENTSVFMGCPEYISYLLTGQKATFLIDPRFIPYIWDEEQAELFNIPFEQLPPYMPLGACLGSVTQQASEHFGLPAGVPVFAGLSDFHAALLGCGVVHPGMTCDRAGTSEGLNYITETPGTHEGLRVLPYLAPGLYTVAGILPASGAIFTWFLKQAQWINVPYEEVLARILAVQDPLPFTFIPNTGKAPGKGFVAGRFSDDGQCDDQPALRGKAVLQVLLQNVELQLQLLEAAGCSISEIRHCGGQARSSSWNQLKAHALQKNIAIPQIPDAELLGCAVVAWTGLGLYPDLKTASDALVQIKTVYSP